MTLWCQRRQQREPKINLADAPMFEAGLARWSAIRWEKAYVRERAERTSG
jgi:hypothetical protein